MAIVQPRPVRAIDNPPLPDYGLHRDGKVSFSLGIRGLVRESGRATGRRSALEVCFLPAPERFYG